MSLKSIRESYSNLITAFSDAGVKLNESQKASLDTFVLALESKMSKQKEKAIKVTKKIVSEHLEKEYKKVFESIMKHQAENAELASKIQSKIQSINESKKIARKVNNYLDLYVESVLPKKTIVDYDRMQKLEKIHESLKTMLVVDEDAVQAKKAELTESFNKDKKALETQIAKLQVKLNESMSKTQKLNAKIDSFKAMELLESKTKDLPTFEARKMKKRFANATTAEIEAQFGKVLESVKKEIEEADAEEETTLEAEIKDIIECDDTKPVKENDPLKGRHHNAHVTEGEDEVDEDDPLKGRHHNGHIAEGEDEDDEPYETTESVKFDNKGNIVLESKDQIGSAEMSMWCDTFNSMF